MKKSTRKESSPQEEMVKLLVLQLKKGTTQQSDLIIQMAGVGFGNTRIAELLGTTPNTVNVTVQKAKRKRKKGK